MAAEPENEVEVEVGDAETETGVKDDAIEEMLVQPGTYFNPQTEVVVVVDDSTSLDQNVFNMEEYEGADWVRVSEEVPIDEERRDEVLAEFQTHYHPGWQGSVSATALEQGDDALDEGEEGQEPGRED